MASCVQLSIYLLNRLSTEGSDWKTPIDTATGQHPDVSAMLAFRWYEPVHVEYIIKQPYPSSTSEHTGRVVGIAENQGDELIFLAFNLRATSSVDREEILANDCYSLATIICGCCRATVDPSDLKLQKSTPQEFVGETFTHVVGDGNTYRAKDMCQIMDKGAENCKQVNFLTEV